MNFSFWCWPPFGSHFGRGLGSPNGGQGHQKATSKKHQNMMPKMNPTWSQRGSQNGAKIVKNDVLEAPCFKGGSQVASRPPPGSILERFCDHFGTMFVSLSDILLWLRPLGRSKETACNAKKRESNMVMHSFSYQTMKASLLLEPIKA